MDIALRRRRSGKLMTGKVTKMRKTEDGRYIADIKKIMKIEDGQQN